MDVIQFELEDGTPVLVEVKDAGREGMQRVSRGDETEKKAAKRFSEALAHIRPAAETVLDAFKQMNTPDEIGLEFGMNFSAKFGVAVFSSAEGGATFKVSLKWKNTKPGTGSAG